MRQKIVILLLLSGCASVPDSNFQTCLFNFKSGESECRYSGPSKKVKNSELDGFVCVPYAEYMGFVLSCDALKKSCD